MRETAAHEIRSGRAISKKSRQLLEEKQKEFET
jgi:hypothetical protein